MTYKGTNAGALSSSLAHSLRHSDVLNKYDEDGNKKEMWNPEKVQNSFMLVDGKKINLAEMPDNEKDELVKSILKDELEDFNGNNEPEYLKDIEKQNEKVLKKKGNLKRNGELFEEFGNLKDGHISNSILKKFIERVNQDDDIKRKNQKIKSLQDFQEMNNELIEMRDGQKSKMDKRNGLVQESFLKFPKMPNGKIEDEKYCEILNDYYAEKFPDYKIKASFYHGDEESLNDNLEDCGGHSHIFVSCKNQKTGKYDLVKEQQKQGIDFIKKNPELFPGIEPDKLKHNYNFNKSKNGEPLTGKEKAENKENNKYLRAIGQAQQIEMINFSQDKLKKYGVSLYRNKYETDAAKKRLAQMEQDKKLPKEQRVHNSHNQKIDKEKKELKHYKNLNQQEQDKHKVYRNVSNNFEEDLNSKRTESKKLDKEINNKNGLLSRVKEEFAKFKNELKEFKNTVFGQKPEQQIEQQAKSTIKQANKVVGALPESKNSVDAGIKNTVEQTSSGPCTECGINPAMYKSLCAGCYSVSDECANDTELSKQAKLKDNLNKNKVGQGFVYKPKGPK